MLAHTAQSEFMALNFMQWATKFNKVYETVEEFERRLALFTENFNTVEAQNKKAVGLKFGLNHMSDWTQEEFESTLGLKNMGSSDMVNEIFPNEVFEGTPNSDSLDWRDVRGVVTPVKDQGQCGSCWAFSATEAVESAYVIAGNEQVIMAPQELVDCAKGLFSSHGCNGGWYYYAYDWLRTHKTMRESDYAYTSGVT